jgi:ABC-type transport system involved in cytochrome c biogenesis permease subunit
MASDKDEKKVPFKPSVKVPLQVLVFIPAVLWFIAAPTKVFASQSRVGWMGETSGIGGALIVLGIYLLFVGFVWAKLAKKQPARENRYWAAVGFVALFFGALVAGLMVKGGQIALTERSPLRIFEFFGATMVAGIFLVFVVHALLGFGRVPAMVNLDGRLLDEINYRAVTLGYPVYTLGALFAGAIWAESAWGAFWSWDPKEVGALIIWLFYSAFLHARYQRGWSGSRTAILSLTGFAMMMLSFFGNYFFGGLHSYN